MPKANMYGDPTGRVVATGDARYPALGSQRDVEPGRVTATFRAYGPGDI